MPLAGSTRAAARRAGRVDRPHPADPHQPRSPPGVALVLVVPRPGGDGAGCNARRRPEAPAPSARVRRSAASPDTRRGPCGSSVRIRVRLGCPHRGAQHLDGFGAEHVVEAAAELRVAVAQGNRTWRPRSPKVSSRLRACWVTQLPLGLAVTPASCTRRVSSSMNTSTCSRLSHTVSTVKKSHATIPAACWRRNTRHVPLPARRGAGSRPWRRSVAWIAVADAAMPSRSSSPLIRW